MKSTRNSYEYMYITKVIMVVHANPKLDMLAVSDGHTHKALTSLEARVTEK